LDTLEIDCDPRDSEPLRAAVTATLKRATDDRFAFHIAAIQIKRRAAE
jgi:hypothetical protein